MLYTTSNYYCSALQNVNSLRIMSLSIKVRFLLEKDYIKKNMLQKVTAILLF